MQQMDIQIRQTLGNVSTAIGHVVGP